jgi:hypothetical protein
MLGDDDGTIGMINGPVVRAGGICDAGASSNRLVSPGEGTGRRGDRAHRVVVGRTSHALVVRRRHGMEIAGVERVAGSRDGHGRASRIIGRRRSPATGVGHVAIAGRVSHFERQDSSIQEKEKNKETQNCWIVQIQYSLMPSPASASCVPQ